MGDVMDKKDYKVLLCRTISSTNALKLIKNEIIPLLIYNRAIDTKIKVPDSYMKLEKVFEGEYLSIPQNDTIYMYIPNNNANFLTVAIDDQPLKVKEQITTDDNTVFILENKSIVNVKDEQRTELIKLGIIDKKKSL